jgi:hypothetical protein
MPTKTDTKKESKKNTKEIETTEEMEAHSIWNGRLKSNSTEAKFFKEFLTDVTERFFDEDGFNSILNCYWGGSIDELDIVIKNQQKRDKKVKEKFTPENLSKPKNAYNLYCTYYAGYCKENEIKFTLKGANDSWKSISDKEKEKYIKEAAKQKSEYADKYKSLKTEAIKNGSLSEDKPKGPMTAFFRYLEDKRESIKQKLIKAGETEKLNTKITSEAGKLWKELSAKEKEKYEKAYSEEKEKYSVILEAWKSKETSRLKKIDGKPEDIKVEESGSSTSNNSNSNSNSNSNNDNDKEVLDIQEEKVSKSKKTSKAKKEESEPKAEKAEKAEKAKKEESEPKAEKVKKSTKTEKPSKVVKKVNLTEDEEEDDEE